MKDDFGHLLDFFQNLKKLKVRHTSPLAKPEGWMIWRVEWSGSEFHVGMDGVGGLVCREPNTGVVLSPVDQHGCRLKPCLRGGGGSNPG
jgi:hypothetical protein